MERGRTGNPAKNIFMTVRTAQIERRSNLTKSQIRSEAKGDTVAAIISTGLIALWGYLEFTPMIMIQAGATAYYAGKSLLNFRRSRI